MSKSKILFIIFGAIAGILAIAGVAIAFSVNYDDIAPAKVEVIDNGEEIFFKSDLNENYHGYRFSFKTDTNSFVYDSQNNVISLQSIKEKLDIGKTYQISSCFLGDNEGGNSKFSQETSWRSYDYLEKIEISFDSSNNIISWNEVQNADYYKVYYKDIIFRQEGISSTQFDLFHLQGGEYTFKVVACSNAVNHKPSESNELNVVYRKKFKPFEKVEFDSENCSLKITAFEKLTAIRVRLNSNNFNIENPKFEENDGKIIYNISIKAIYNGQSQIGASPVSQDEYNIYSGLITYA